jgi:hypothetical protein
MAIRDGAAGKGSASLGQRTIKGEGEARVRENKAKSKKKS